ncbi:hypothetical protein NDU88_001356 [Pleurodeles waltl]|uniref:Uncharacterized protein n=1 Tax=Pleurodeles waltl TaxID=8319 RepID=A0AAV7S7C1_PLEWA|nr:hypothetical protein NDU88_001356 [Pleurodeles waltl]
MRALEGTHDLTPRRYAAILTLGDLYEDGVLRSFQNLQDTYVLRAGSFLTYNAFLLKLRRAWNMVQEEPPLHHGLDAMGDEY